MERFRFFIFIPIILLIFSFTNCNEINGKQNRKAIEDILRIELPTDIENSSLHYAKFDTYETIYTYHYIKIGVIVKSI